MTTRDRSSLATVLRVWTLVYTQRTFRLLARGDYKGQHLAAMGADQALRLAEELDPDSAKEAA